MDSLKQELRECFFEEGADFLTQLEEALIGLESYPEDPSRLESAFRIAHNLKGNARAAEFVDLADFFHRYENALSWLRDNQGSLTKNSITILFDGLDLSRRWIFELQGKEDYKPDLDGLLQNLEMLCQSEAQGESRPSAPAAPTETLVSVGNPFEKIQVRAEEINELIEILDQMKTLEMLIEPHKASLQNEGFKKSLDKISAAIEKAHEKALKFKMLPMGSVQMKLRRVALDAARTVNKQVNMDFSGMETRVDKEVIELLIDPLLHMIRNSVDHGIELPEERKARGKKEAGEISLSACLEGGQLIIDLEDDGKGIDRHFIRKKAIEKSLIKEEESLSDEETLLLIFRPGFSTKEEVTNLSGRGVGMDVVRTNIEQKLGGKISVSSELGKGTKIQISAPLQTAEVDGIILRRSN